ncbi:MAG: HAD-IA family hydrolase [Betaproteobacteria bacterium]|nr:HAD-IA family hydrolase [Betaproteobacteria bacterium]MDH5222560.1 HAD-IA family hydrolase [Betaproteobacteria bacterium]MDH5352284.1 HAD-IA family hydrolase [Betaproteobacteria bacterium]
MRRYDAVLFDLLTALIDSWSLWNRIAGSEDAGRAWRGEYLKLTYGCGAYRPYETLVAEAAVASGLPATHAKALEDEWLSLEPWEDARPLLRRLRQDYKLGVVTNCSERLGRFAAMRMEVPFDVVVTSERAGFYKPRPQPYALALQELALPASRVLFVCGSAFDLFGTAQVGMATLWHNRVGLNKPADAPAPLKESRTLEPMVSEHVA